MSVTILKSTPWGKPQSVDIVSNAGIVFYSTASHGGYKVDAQLNKLVPEVFRKAAEVWTGKPGWYEEDCAAAIVAFFLGDRFDLPANKLAAQQTIERWYPHQWQEYKGEPVAKSDKCWDCQKNTCHATANQFPKEIGNTGYGNYCVLTQEVAPNTVETRVFCQGLIVELATTGQINHSLCVDRVMRGYYEQFGNVPAFPIIKAVA